MLAIFKTACGASQIKEIPNRRPDYMLPLMSKRDWSRVYADEQDLPGAEIRYNYEAGEQLTIDVYEEAL